MTAMYFALTFLVSWTFWLTAGALTARSIAAGSAPTPATTVLVYLGVFGPAFVAVAMTLWAGGAAEVRALLSRLVQWRVGFRWYLFAIAFMAVVKVTMAALHRVALGAWPGFGSTPVLAMLAATVISVLILGQSGEELGWRGYALPRLASRIGLGWASVVLGIIWAVWHLPIFFVFPSADKFGQSFPLYLAQVTGLSVAMAWLWWRTNGSLLLTMLLHAAINNTKDIVPSASAGARSVWTLGASPAAWMTVGVLWTFAALFLLDMRKAAVQTPARAVPSAA